MYSKKFWDEIYINHYQDAPWMDDSWKTNVYKTIEEDIALYAKQGSRPLHLLDYGCGNGRMGYYFSTLGMVVDLSDISSVLVERLKEEYKGCKNVRVFRTATPKALFRREKYDIVIAWNLFHHLKPTIWHQFVSEFLDRMKMGGLLFISGWDKDDAVIKDDHNRARYTQHTTWFINDLPEYIQDLPCEVLIDRKLEEEVPVFATKRQFRYFVIKKK